MELLRMPSFWMMLVILVLCALLVMREYQNWKDRKDLIDRLMSIDFREYKRFATPPPKPGNFVKGNMTEEELYRMELEEKGVPIKN